MRRIFIIKSSLSHTDPADVLLLIFFSSSVLLILVIRCLHHDGDQMTSPPPWHRVSPVLRRRLLWWPWRLLWWHWRILWWPWRLLWCLPGLRGQRAQRHHQGGHQVVTQQDLGGIHPVCLEVMSAESGKLIKTYILTFLLISWGCSEVSLSLLQRNLPPYKNVHFLFSSYVISTSSCLSGKGPAHKHSSLKRKHNRMQSQAGSR